jgi:hypothetical protein
VLIQFDATGGLAYLKEKHKVFLSGHPVLRQIKIVPVANLTILKEKLEIFLSGHPACHTEPASRTLTKSFRLTAFGWLSK